MASEMGTDELQSIEKNLSSSVPSPNEVENSVLVSPENLAERFDTPQVEMEECLGNKEVDALMEPVGSPSEEGSMAIAGGSGDSGISEMEMTSSCSPPLPSCPEDSLDTSMEIPMEPSPPSSPTSSTTSDDDDDDVSSTISDLSGVSDLSGMDWRPDCGPMSWIQRHMSQGTNPRKLLQQLLQGQSDAEDCLPEGIDDFTVWKIIVNMLSEPPRRKKLTNFNTIDDAVELIRRSKNIVVLTGAGVSVSCGIPDFRSRTGIYSRLAKDFPNLTDPQSMFDIQYFNRDPRPFFKFAREIYPGQFKPSPCHRFIRALELHGKLLRNYTQNIDTLEQAAGIQRVVQCHGSFATATCTRCKHKVSADVIKEDIFQQRIPLCPICPPVPLPNPDTAPLSMDGPQESSPSFLPHQQPGIMKPDIVFFGEGLPEHFHSAMSSDKSECDLLLVVGSSMKVRPVALIPSSLPPHVPQILINRETLPHLSVDIELLGDADVIIDHLAKLLAGDWTDICWRDEPLKFHQGPSATAQNLRKRTSDVLSDSSDECSPKKVKLNDKQQPSSSTVNGGENSFCSRQFKPRQMSSDSGTRDSGIAELRDANVDETNLGSDSDPDWGAEWLHLPENSYMFLPPHRYLFPGVEESSLAYLNRRRRRSTESDRDSIDSSPIDYKSDHIDHIVHSPSAAEVLESSAQAASSL